jgi:hypothetical protein
MLAHPQILPEPPFLNYEATGHCEDEDRKRYGRC